jgi:hypothetical protein
MPIDPTCGRDRFDSRAWLFIRVGWGHRRSTSRCRRAGSGKSRSPCGKLRRTFAAHATLCPALGFSGMRNNWIACASGALAGVIVVSSMLCLAPKSAADEVIVRVAPPVVRVETAPPPPSHYHVWDPGHWRWNGRGYVWVPGHYIHNPHHYAKWIPGHWVNRGGGWYWVEGHWRH